MRGSCRGALCLPPRVVFVREVPTSNCDLCGAACYDGDALNYGCVNCDNGEMVA